VGSLSTRLEESQRRVAELHERQERELLESRRESEGLRASNEQQQQEITNLRNQLQTSEALVRQGIMECEESRAREVQWESRVGELGSQLEELAADKNKRLEQLEAASSKLAESERNIEELQAMQNETQSEIQRLEEANRELQQRNQEMTEELRQREARLAEMAQASDESAVHCTELQSQIADLEKRVEEARARAQDFDTLQQRLANAESREAAFREQEQALKAQVLDLQREVTAESDRVRELQASCRHLVEMEQSCKELQEENRQLREEISNGQQRLAASEKNGQELVLLRRQFEALKTGQAASLDEAVAEETHAVEVAQETMVPSDPVVPIAVESEESASRADINDASNPLQLNPDRSVDSESGKGRALKKAFERSMGRRSRLVPAGLVLGLIGIAALGVLASRSPENDAALPEAVAEQSAPPSEPSSIVQETKPAPRLRGAFRITRSTPVYSGPSEMTTLIANVQPGMKINVVDSRDGWLEIRSKHGRPPGFVRQEAAVRIGVK
jgi:myosin heavy subunit